ncbi:MAG: DDE transposase family protein [Saprospiraceae bacterium]|nr:DDE transposase family protein [Saprospiraceae bacterium]
MTIDQKKEFAKLLYVRERLTQKEVATRAEVSEQTMVKWVREYGWEKLRRSLLVTKQEQIARLYDQIESLNTEIGDGYADSKQADVITKLTAAIRNMETEVNIGERVEVCMELCDYTRQVAPEKASELVTLCDSFIKSMLKR